jgi:hypothetical protein
MKKRYNKVYTDIFLGGFSMVFHRLLLWWRLRQLQYPEIPLMDDWANEPERQVSIRELFVMPGMELGYLIGQLTSKEVGLWYF